MRETLCAEVDLTDVVVNVVNQDHYSAVSVAIFGSTHLSNSKPGLTICRTGVTKRYSLVYL